ncbi:vesicle transport through interaction with t-SNAREs homolog 1B [Euwallacea fornicatus]|uniref:vesicle transport through interaction with t-SNAREs homolog 1B n=1 Tax=Euwallacea fornicatus TaxID=995702 RepID=UPI00339033B7
MFPRRPTYNWDAHNRQVVLEGTQALERTSESIARSHQIAIETENIGTEVVNELGEQRETLLHTRDRLEEANSQLDNAKSLITKMGRNVLYNKIILIVIILLETIILGALSYIRFFKG